MAEYLTSAGDTFASVWFQMVSGVWTTDQALVCGVVWVRSSAGAVCRVHERDGL